MPRQQPTATTARRYSVTRWLVYLMGFRQHEGHLTGLEQLYYEARRRFGYWPHEIRLYTYRDDLAAIADAIAKQSAPHATITLTGYSLGGGSAVRLARLLAARDRTVDTLYLCDAVARERNPLSWWRCYFGRGLLKIPANVRRVISCRQTFDFPRGSKVCLESTDTKHEQIFHSRVISHLWIDEAVRFHDRHINDLSQMISQSGTEP